jgi:DNA-binding NtrC family response regulator
MKNQVLVIDDDESTIDLMKFQLESQGFEVTTAALGSSALAAVHERDFDIILADFNLPDVNGIELVKRIKEIAPDTEIIMVTGYGSMETAIEATKAGAFFFIEKPINFDELGILIGKAIESKKQKSEIKELRGRLTNRTSYEGIVGGSRVMQDIYEIIESVADSDANILILGESGTGKEVIANAIHYKSLRAKKPFIKVNCSALPKDLIESQLFGHTRGSFTGATSDKMGYIGQANGGSLLLDEIGEMPIELQPKLLRVLQERVYYRVGSDRPQEVDFRLICSTNRNPLDAIADGTLREDLYYRINTIEIKIPPLRERMEDIPILAEHFLQIYADKYKGSPMKFSQRAYDQMLGYAWRGNVRELQHTVERAVLLCKGDVILGLGVEASPELAGRITYADIAQQLVASEPNGDGEVSLKGVVSLAGMKPDEAFEQIGRVVVDSLPEPADGAQQKDVFDALEVGVVLAALKRTKGNKQAAANLLGLYRPRLYGMIKRHNLASRV